ncbi:NAD(P)H-hydrate dehydratase [Candidatus Dojkabacteria bacterium]|nr:NAD(P)H-hydrate dehydratase [Candidatus Dojkabacteria bacterium]
MDQFELAKIKETNARYFGMSELEMVENAGIVLAKELESLVNKQKKKEIVVSIVCGLGNNGADGMAMARSFVKKKKQKQVEVNVYLVGREQQLKTEEAKEQFYRLKTLKRSKGLNVQQDCYAKDIVNSDIVIEALLGSGAKGKIRKRFADIVKKIVRMKALRVAIDVPVPGYVPNETWSLITPKRKKAKVLDIGLPKEVEDHVGPGDIKFMYEPSKDSYKSKNGELLILGGSETFHGAPLLSIMAASKFVGSVFFYTVPENRKFIDRLKSEYCEFIALKDKDLEKYAGYVDVVLAGPGLEEDLINQSLLTQLMNKYREKVFVLDAYAISMVNPDRNKLNKRGFKNTILTPHRGELRHIFDETKLTGLEGKLRRFAKENECNIALKGSTDMLFSSDGVMKFNKTGNPGMAKGGTGDVMAGLIAALACKNSAWEAMKAGTFLSGISGDLVSKKFGYNFSASDEIPFIQEAYRWAKNF